MKPTRRLFVGILASLALVLGIGAVEAVNPPPAAAAVKFYVCNANGSDEWIAVKRGDNLGTEYLAPNQCTNPVVAAGTRVDVDTTGTFSNGVDIDSYEIAVDGNYGVCHHGETNDSDPPNQPAKITYHNSTGAFCL